MSSNNSISFDSKGNLVPYDLIPLSYSQFKEFFIAPFKDSSPRASIYEGFCRYCAEMFRIMRADWLQWLDGSYVTTEANPKDLDLVNIIRIEILDRTGRALDPFATGPGNPSGAFRVHAFTIPECSPKDYRYGYCVAKQTHWKKWFGRDRYKNPKGIVQMHQTGDN